MTRTMIASDDDLAWTIRGVVDALRAWRLDHAPWSVEAIDALNAAELGLLKAIAPLERTGRLVLTHRLTPAVCANDTEAA